MRYNQTMTAAGSDLRVQDVATEHDKVAVLAVAGELDLATVKTFREVVTGRLDGSADVVLDVAGLAFCDSTGLGAIVGLHRAAKEAGVRLVLAAPRQRLASLLQISGVDRVVGVYRSVDAAARGLAEPAA